MVALRTTVASLVLFFGACGVGEVPLPGGATDAGGGAGAQTFVTQVKPLVARCAVAACHGGVQPPNLTSFDTLAATYKIKPGASNILVTHVADGVIHNGVAYLSTQDKVTVSAWIDSLP